jgi:hypothetical protein
VSCPHPPNRVRQGPSTDIENPNRPGATASYQWGMCVDCQALLERIIPHEQPGAWQKYHGLASNRSLASHRSQVRTLEDAG